MRVEFQKETLPEIEQTSDNAEYDGWDKRKNPKLVHVSNFKYAILQKNKECFFRKKSDKFGKVSDISFKDIAIICDDKTIIPKIYVVSDDEPFENIGFENIILNGKKVHDFSDFETEIKNTNEVVIK